MIVRTLGSLTAWHHPEFPLAHGFFGRQGGVSSPPFASFNTAYRTEDDKAGENRHHLLSTLGLGQQPGRILNPCHGNQVAWLEDGDWQRESQGVLLQTDGAFSQRSGSWLLVSTADCIPLLLTNRQGTLAGVVHLGWRNVVANLAGQAIATACRHTGLEPEEWIALLGPAIQACCYRFSDPGQRNDPFWHPFLHQGEDGLYAIDLLAATRAQLQGCGVPAQNILETGICTACANDRFFSCYKEGYRSGRFPTVVWLK